MNIYVQSRIGYLGLIFCLSLSACGGQEVDRAPSSSSTSSTSNSSSSTSSSSSSSASSSSSSTGGPNTAGADGLTFWASVSEFCPSSVGINKGTYFDVESSTKGRVDFAGAIMQGGPLSSFTRSVSYANGSDQAIEMNMWSNGGYYKKTLSFPPTGGWNVFKTMELESGGQLSFTSNSDQGGPHISALYYTWQVDCSLECGGYGTPSFTACPDSPLPGTPAEAATPPTAKGNITFAITNAPATVSFSASHSTDANLETLNYHWDFDDGSEGEGEEIEHTFFTPGYYIVTLTVTDPGGLSDKQIIHANIPGDDPSNSKPEAIISAERFNLLRPYTTVEVSGSQSFDPDGDPLELIWRADSIEGHLHATELQLDLADDNFSQQARLTVSDGRGGVNHITEIFHVLDAPDHHCDISYIDSYPKFEANVRLFNNSPTPISNWQAKFQIDSAAVSVANNPSIRDSHTETVQVSGSNPYIFSGVDQPDIPAYSWVAFQITGESDLVIQDVNVNSLGGLECIERMPERKNHRPVAKITATPPMGPSPLTVTLSGADSFDPDGDLITNYRWYLGDSFQKEGKIITHTYARANTFPIRLVVSDGHSESWTEIPIEVTGEPGIGCRTQLLTTNGSTGEYTAYINFSNYNEFPAQLNSGYISLSEPISITAADEGSGIDLNDSTTKIQFDLGTGITLDYGDQYTLHFEGFMPPYQETPNSYFTDCTFK